jgi:DtxR family Mn-dependent transcriptional regulator
MSLSERAEEILETLWVQCEEKRQPSQTALPARGDAAWEELIRTGNVQVNENDIELTGQGKREGGLVVRRHRLGERLFADVLDFKADLVHTVSCQFEHLLHDGLEDQICILLGHPRTCPHGRAIPPGACCHERKETVEKIISTLSRLKSGQSGKVAYLHTQDRDKLQKLLSLGVLPGMTIQLLASYPSYVFQVGASQFAVDQELADNIFVRVDHGAVSRP